MNGPLDLSGVWYGRYSGRIDGDGVVIDDSWNLGSLSRIAGGGATKWGKSR